jgi:RNA polymerase sigma-70 factor (ECF subfamily)
LSYDRKIISDQVEIDIKRLIEALPIDQQEVLVMRMYQDMSFKEISEITGGINTSLGRMRYALMNLRKVIDKHQIVLTN